ncbi:MAG: F0F1 ATP synthase subunit epsilon [Burkholderiales bacterium]|nr:F0F1 ATP synthase subunit epsilon [Burkholderiales bacterium]
MAKVESFVGQDDSGSFGILAGHARLITVLSYGLSRFRLAGDADWTYLALPGGVLHFSQGILTIVTRRYFLDKRYSEISRMLLEQLVSEEKELAAMKENIGRLEQEMMRKLWQMERATNGSR